LQLNLGVSRTIESLKGLRQVQQVPWERPILAKTPTEFERMVVDYLASLGHPLKSFSVQHQARVTSPEGIYNMDAVAVFEALGAEFVVLVECKHHKNPIKRELVQILADKVTSTRAQKGMLFSTAPFQRGALDFAKERGIALIHFTEGGPVFETKSYGEPRGPNRPYDAYWVTVANDGGMSYRFGAQDDLASEIFSRAG
jgi:restriction system protein